MLMPVLRAGIISCAFAVAAGLVAGLRGATTWLALSCAAGTAVVVMAAWFVAGGGFRTRSAKPDLSGRTDKAARRILAHVNEEHTAGDTRRVADEFEGILAAVGGLAGPAHTDPIVNETAAYYVARLEKLNLRGRSIDSLLEDLRTIRTSLEKIKPKQPNRSAP